MIQKFLVVANDFISETTVGKILSAVTLAIGCLTVSLLLFRCYNVNKLRLLALNGVMFLIYQTCGATPVGHASVAAITGFYRVLKYCVQYPEIFVVLLILLVILSFRIVQLPMILLIGYIGKTLSWYSCEIRCIKSICEMRCIKFIRYKMRSNRNSDTDTRAVMSELDDRLKSIETKLNNIETILKQIQEEHE